MKKKKDQKAPEKIEEKQKFTLPHYFSDRELLDIGKEQSKIIQKIVELKAEKKSSAKQFDSDIALQEQLMNEKANKINSGSEERLVECLVTYHEPVEGEKTIVRLDTNEKVETVEMTNADYRLFYGDEELQKLEDIKNNPEENESEGNDDN